MRFFPGDTFAELGKVGIFRTVFNKAEKIAALGLMFRPDMAAESQGKSLNTWAADVIENAARR